MTGPARVARRLLHHSKIETPLMPVCGLVIGGNLDLKNAIHIVEPDAYKFLAHEDKREVCLNCLLWMARQTLEGKLVVKKRKRAACGSRVHT